MTSCISNNHGQFKRHSPWLLTSTILCTTKSQVEISCHTMFVNWGLLSCAAKNDRENRRGQSCYDNENSEKVDHRNSCFCFNERREERKRENCFSCRLRRWRESCCQHHHHDHHVVLYDSCHVSLSCLCVKHTPRETTYDIRFVFCVHLSSPSSFIIILDDQVEKEPMKHFFFASPSKTWSEGKWKRQEGEKERKSGTCLSLPKRFVCPFPWKTRSRWL